MILRLLAVIALLFVISCEEKTGPPNETETIAPVEERAATVGPEKPKIQFEGEFGTTGQRPVREGTPEVVEVPKEIVAKVNDVAEERIGSAFAIREMSDGATFRVTLGGPAEADGLRVAITHRGRAVAHHVPPATNEPELVSNLDHTVDRVLDELGVPRK